METCFAPLLRWVLHWWQGSPVAVANLWLVSVGGAAEDTTASITVLDVTELVGQQRRQRRAPRLRLVSVF